MSHLLFRVDGPGAAFGSYLYAQECHVCGAVAGDPCRRDDDGRAFYVHVDRGSDPDDGEGES